MPDYLALPDEVVAETILWKLPVKSIMQCMCVCKSWYSLIKSPNFISNHIVRKTLTNKNPQIFLNPEEERDESSCLIAFDYQDYFRSILFHLLEVPPDPWIQIVGFVNGLICFSIGEGRVERIVNLVLCNLSIGHFHSIPQPHSSLIDWGVRSLGFDESTLDYIILLISGEIGFIYSFNSNSWRRFTCPFPVYSDMLSNPVFVNGRFHWLHLTGPILARLIMVFDVKSEAFSHISLLKCLENPDRYNVLLCMEYGDSSIAIMQYHGNERNIWILKEYGSVESWMKLPIFAYLPVVSVLGFRNADEVLIKCDTGCIASLKIKNNKLDCKVEKLTDVYNRHSLNFGVYKYVPSIVLLDKENNDDVVPPTHTLVDISAPSGYRVPDNADPTRRKRKSNSQS